MLINLSHMDTVLEYIRTHKKCRVQCNGTEIFSTHTIIRVYCKMYEHEYVLWIVNHQHDEQVFQTVHSHIGRDLSENMARLRIRKYHVSQKSLTIHHTDDYPMWWEFTSI